MFDIGTEQHPQPPYNNEAEQALLGALLSNNRAFERVADILKPEYFYDGVHGRIYAALAKLIDRGEIANPVTLKGFFDQDEALAAIGGAKYLARLAGAGVIAMNAQNYAQTITDLWLRRQIMEAMNDGIADATVIDYEQPATMVLEGIEARLAQLGEKRDEGGPRHIYDVATAALNEIQDAYRKGGSPGVTTGLLDLDKALGGLHDGDLIVVGGRPGMGKSALLGTISMAAARDFKRQADDGEPRKSAAIFELEMTAEQLSGRYFADITGISAERQRQGDIDQHDFGVLMAARDAFETQPIHIDASPSLSLAQIRSRARRIKRRHGLGLLIVDYLQLIRPSNPRDERRNQVGEISRGLKALAKELHVPVVLLSALGREVDKREDKRPVMSDLKESGDIEADADSIVFVYRHEVYLLKAEPIRRDGEDDDKFDRRRSMWAGECERHKNKASLIIAKNRHGRAPQDVDVFFNGERSRFENLAQPSFGAQL